MNKVYSITVIEQEYQRHKSTVLADCQFHSYAIIEPKLFQNKEG